MRELTLTKRTFEQVLDAASGAVFRERVPARIRRGTAIT
jgi:hypothetical protein